eukprot:gene6883-11045_t
MPIKEDEVELTSSDSLENRSQPVSVRNLLRNVSESDVYNLEEFEVEDEEDDENSYSVWIRKNIARGYCYSSISGSQKFGNCLDTLKPCEYDQDTDTGFFNEFKRPQMIFKVKRGKHRAVTMKIDGTKFVVEYKSEDCTVKCCYVDKKQNFQLLTDLVMYQNETYNEKIRICAQNLT